MFLTDMAYIVSCAQWRLRIIYDSHDETADILSSLHVDGETKTSNSEISCHLLLIEMTYPESISILVS